MSKWLFIPALAFAAACSPGTVESPQRGLVWRASAAGSSAAGTSAAWIPPNGSAAANGGALAQPSATTQAAETQGPVVNNNGNTPYAGVAGSNASAPATAGRGASAGSAAPSQPTAASSGAAGRNSGTTGSAGRNSGAADMGGSPAANNGGSSAPTTSVGTGEIDHPVVGPAPSDAAKVKGAPFVLVKNWDFGENGTIRDIEDLNSEFYYQDQWGTIANGSNYGAVIVAPSADKAVSASGLGLPNNKQPVEDPARPTREWTDSTLLAHVRPLSTSQQTVTASKHDAGCGSFTAKWTLPSGGALLGKDLLWETRVRMPVPLAGYWYAIWTAGKQWDHGAEMDVMESFGAPHIPADAFHTNSVGGSDVIDFSAWPEGLDKGGVPDSARDLKDWHTWTWVYLKDDSYVVYYDGYEVQRGKIHWTLGGTSSGAKIDMSFLFDFGWGHTQVSDVNISLPAAKFPLTYEIDYSRVYLR